MNSETNGIEKLLTMIRDIKFTMLTTVASDGTIHSRPMGTLKTDPENFEGGLWFFSRKNSLKNDELKSDQHVNLVYTDPDKKRYVSVCGWASISEDKKKMKELWMNELKSWFPEGLNDPEISLISVRPESAEIWDAPPGKLIQLLRFVKSTVTGKPIHQKNESEHIQLGH